MNPLLVALGLIGAGLALALWKGEDDEHETDSRTERSSNRGDSANRAHSDDSQPDRTGRVVVQNFYGGKHDESVSKLPENEPGGPSGRGRSQSRDDSGGKQAPGAESDNSQSAVKEPEHGAKAKKGKAKESAAADEKG